MNMRFRLLSVVLALFVAAGCLRANEHSILEVTHVDEMSHRADGKLSGFNPRGCYILIDGEDSPVIRKVAEMFSSDVARVTGVKPQISTEVRVGEPAVIIGVAGKSRHIGNLERNGVIDVDSLKGEWERYRVVTASSPVAGIPEALIVAGSDRRGAAYGVFSVSEAMGVSPWEWWADVPVRQAGDIRIVADYISAPPSVKYRGIFINDEDWGLKPWATYNYEKELGDIGPRTYARVCELLLRLKGNMLAPAMHACTGAFYSHPESKVVADTYGIIITTSHCEPMLLNNAALSEWDSERDGEWNYRTNKETIYNKFDARIKEACMYENIYTMAMRGVHDEGMKGNLPMAERVGLLDEVIADQRGILERHINRKASEIPQIFVPYKETLDIYEAGLDLPDDITIIWPDDNYGYWKHLSDDTERRRGGGAGVYYHTSYLGTPHDYLWLCTTPPVLMYEELKKAYDYGADRYWLLNVGDIKPMEMAVQTFFEIAWDFGAFDYEKALTHQARMLAGIFGKSYLERFQRLTDGYYRLAWSRKPEYMGWEREWDTPELEQLGPTEYSFENYNDARTRLADYKAISDEAARIAGELADSLRAPFFEMIGYPAMASYQINRKYLMAQLNGELLAKGDTARASRAGRLALAAHDSIAALNRQYNGMLGGKWKGMMDVPPGFVAKYQDMPEVFVSDAVPEVMVSVEPDESQASLDRCHVVKLWEPLESDKGIRVIDGLGYDWSVVQLGEARPGADVSGECVTYELPAVDSDTVSVTVYALPFFPLNNETGTRYGVSVDGGEMQVVDYKPVEWSHDWKSNVLRNSTANEFVFRVDPALASHRLTLHAIDAGQMVQRIVVDWGGLKRTYVGPSARM